MDLDELLARSLQVEQAQQQQQQLNDQQRQVLGVIQQNQFKAQSVEDPRLFAQARSLMPLDAWRQQAREQVELNQQLQPAGGGGGGAATTTAAVDDLVVKSMLQWFKRDFFSWVNNPPCSTCGNANTEHIGMAAPEAAERPHAGRVECYNCSTCGQVTRFPRYNTPGKLLETKRGRCGEWAHCFLLMLRAAGYDARHVCDNADHVWCEYWSRALGRWVHVDSCEAAWDTPLLYEGGWGKKLGFVLAASWHGHADVTRRYVLPTALPQLATRRAGVPEQWLEGVLQQATTRLRLHLAPRQRRALAARDAVELLQLMALDSNAQAAAAAEAAAADLPGRQSGAEAWRVARGETGAAGSSSQQPAVQPPTAYVRAADTTLPQLFTAAGRVTGGVCRASGEHTGGSPSQVPLRLFDGSLATKWLDFGGGGAAGAAWVEYRLLPSEEPVVVTHYDVIAAEDCPERDPYDWVLEAATSSSNSSSSASAAAGSSSSGNSSEDTWVVLHTCRGHRFSRRHQLCSFIVPPETRVASRAWRLRVTKVANPSQATCVQLACWNLYHAPRECAEQQLLYLDSAMCTQLQAVAAGAEGKQRDEAVSTLQRILQNVQQQSDAKYFKLSVKSAKLQQLLSDRLLQDAVLAAGFRPVLQVASAVEQGELALVADDSSGAARAAASTLQQLIDTDTSGKGPAAVAKS